MKNKKSILNLAIDLLSDENIKEQGLVNVYQQLFGFEHISYDNAQRQLRGIKKFIEKIQSEEDEVNFNNIQSQKIDLNINSDGTQTRNALLILSEEEIKTEELLLKAHGYNPEQFELVNSKNSMWHQNSNTSGLTTLYCSKITVRPRNEISLTTVEKIFEKLSRNTPNKIIKIENPYEGKEGKHECLILNFFDVHFSKLAHSSETEENYDYKIAKKRLLDSTDEYISRFANRHFENIYFAVGQDYFNSEPTAQTIAGTKQDNDSRYSVMFEKGVETLIAIIEKLRMIGDTIYIPLIPGNHSGYTEYYAAQFLKAWYRNDENIIIDASPIPRKYFKYGVNLFGFTHNSEEKNRINNLMQVEAPKYWADTIERTWFTGHLHCEDVKESGGVYIRQAPTLCGTDAWHKKCGYVNPIKRTQAFIYDKEFGLQSINYVMVK